MTEAERLFWQARIPLRKLVQMGDEEAYRWLSEMRDRLNAALREDKRESAKDGL